MANDLLASLRRLGDAEHDDLSVAHDALAEIVNLRLEVERLRTAAERYRWLTENCLHSFSMTQDEPAEHTLVFEYCQASLDEAGWSIHDAIDKAMEASNAG